MSKRLASAGLAGAVLLLTALPGVASAGILFREKYTWGPDTGSFDDCGFEIAITSRGGGLSIIRDATPRTGGQFFRLSDNYWVVERFTNPANGRWVERTGDGNFFELPPSEISADQTVFTYRTRDAGQPFTVRDSEGNLLMRDRGSLTIEYVFDTFGDGEPGGEPLQEPVVVKVAGPHPGYGSGCEDLQEWIG